MKRPPVRSRLLSQKKYREKNKLTAKQSAPVVATQATRASAAMTLICRTSHDEPRRLVASEPLEAAFADTERNGSATPRWSKPPFCGPFPTQRTGCGCLVRF